jgi:glycosyltransferase involved in cell wall biosynthesis
MRSWPVFRRGRWAAGASLALSDGISVVIMAYDEVASLEGVAREIHATLIRVGSPHEIVIVDDGSSDGTGEAADRLSRELPGLRVVHHQPNQGLGGVYRTGFREARRELVTFFPADGQFSAGIIEQFAPLCAECDFVLGYLPEQSRSPQARFLSWAERVLYLILFGPLPRFQGILMFRRAVLDRLTLGSEGRGWAVLMELLIRASRAGHRMCSVPIELRPRLIGTSKVQNLRTIVSNLRQVLALRAQL